MEKVGKQKLHTFYRANINRDNKAMKERKRVIEIIKIFNSIVSNIDQNFVSFVASSMN